MCFAKAISWDTNDARKKTVSLSNIAKKVQLDNFFKHSNVAILTEAPG